MKRKFFVSLTLVFVLVFSCSLAALAEEKKTETKEKKATSEKNDKKTESTEKVLIEVNSASLEELQELPGIGPKLAQAIIDGRPYDGVDALMEVKGIGEKKLEKIKTLVEVKPLKKDTKKKTEEEPKEDTKKDEKKSEEKPKKK